MKHTLFIQSPASKILPVISITHSAKQHSITLLWYQIFPQNVSAFRPQPQEMTLKRTIGMLIEAASGRIAQIPQRAGSLWIADYAGLMCTPASFGACPQGAQQGGVEKPGLQAYRLFEFETRFLRYVRSGLRSQ